MRTRQSHTPGAPTPHELLQHMQSTEHSSPPPVGRHSSVEVMAQHELALQTWVSHSLLLVQ